MVRRNAPDTRTVAERRDAFWRAVRRRRRPHNTRNGPDDERTPLPATITTLCAYRVSVVAPDASLEDICVTFARDANDPDGDCHVAWAFFLDEPLYDELDATTRCATLYAFAHAVLAQP